MRPEASIQINLRINYPVILIAVLILHILLMGVKGLEMLSVSRSDERTNEVTPLKIQRIRTVGAKDASLRESVYLQKSNSKVETIDPRKISQHKENISFRDLNLPTPAMKQRTETSKSTARPGTRPEVARAKAIQGIQLSGSEIAKFSNDSPAGTVAGSLAQSLNNSDVAVNLEVPAGVTPDELNEYELMFYGFQRRTAMGYINSFYKNLDRFQRANPHLQFPMTDTKQVMTGRLTYDEKGNVKQIKMIRWSNVDKLQDFFVDVLKDMDTLHNPPKLLWEKNGEFAVFFTLVVNG